MSRLRKELTPVYRKLVSNLQSAQEFIPNYETAVPQVHRPPECGDRQIHPPDPETNPKTR